MSALRPFAGVGCVMVSAKTPASPPTNEFRVPYGFGNARFGPLALLTFITLSAWSPCGVVTTKVSGQLVRLRSSPTVFAETLMSRSTWTRIVPGKPPRAIWSAAMLLGLYCMASLNHVIWITLDFAYSTFASVIDSTPSLACESRSKKMLSRMNRL